MLNANKEIANNTEDNVFVADETIEGLIYEIEKVRVQMKALTDTDKELKEELKAIVDNAEYIVDKSGYEIATWKISRTNRFDADAFKTDYPAIYKDYLKQSEQRRFMTKPRKVA